MSMKAKPSYMEPYEEIKIKTQQIQVDPPQATFQTVIERLKNKIFRFNSAETQRFVRLLELTEMINQYDKYPQLLRVYMTYNWASIFAVSLAIIIPKRIVNKVLISLIIYGFKTNFLDGMYTYYAIQKLSLGDHMTQKEQELRNVLEFHYKFSAFKQKELNLEDQKSQEEFLQKIKEASQKYLKFKELEKII